MSISASPLGNNFFAEVTGVDIAAGVSDADIADIRAAFNEFGVLLFRGQEIDNEQQIDFSGRFGTLETGGLLKRGTHNLPGNPVAVMSNVDADGNFISTDSVRARFTAADRLWHSDSSFKPVPARASLLHGRVIPPADGNTEFADGRAAYDALTDERKEMLEDLVALNDLRYSREQVGFTEFNEEEDAAWPAVPQPMVRRHEETGRPNLFVGSHASEIVGMPFAEGRALLRELLEHATQPQFVHAHQWQQFDLVMWDNRCTLHRVRPFDATNHRRTMHRTTVAGTGPTVADNGPVDEPARFHQAA